MVCVECLHGCWYEPVRGRNVIFYTLMQVCRKKTSSKKNFTAPKYVVKHTIKRNLTYLFRKKAQLLRNQKKSSTFAKCLGPNFLNGKQMCFLLYSLSNALLHTHRTRFMKNKHILRTGWNNLLQGGIRLCMLSAVAFTFAACYGPAPYDPDEYNRFLESQDSTNQTDHRQELEQRLAEIADAIEDEE